MITCIVCQRVICHEAEFTPYGSEITEDGVICPQCVTEAARGKVRESTEREVSSLRAEP